ncbi:hypothetical protein ABW21_db0202860 [Orbilia brochopaga]|nr:hypothetical protein ABW21_db0202860 [Drechslerella brochopaga]
MANNNGESDSVSSPSTMEQTPSLPDEFSLSASFVFGALEVLLALNSPPPSTITSNSESADPAWDIFQMASTMANSTKKPIGTDPSRPAVPAPGASTYTSGPPPTPSKIPLPPTPCSPLSLKGQQHPGTPNDAAGTNNFPGTSTAMPRYSFPTQSGLPSLVFPPATHQAYHTRNLLLHIYSMFNGAQAAIHQLGANCEFNQNLITFLSSQVVEKDRKIQTLTASVNMLQTAVQRAMKNNEELKKTEESLQEEIKALQSASDGSDTSKEDAELVAKLDTLTLELDAQRAESASMARDHDRKVGELEKEVEDMKETVEILEESLRYAVSMQFPEAEANGNGDAADRDGAELHELRNDEDRAEKMLNGRLEDASATSDDSLIDEVNGVTHRENGHMFTDGASSSSGSGYLSGRPIYLDSIMEEPEEEEDKEAETPANQQEEVPIPQITCIAPIGGVTKLRATAKPFVGSGEANMGYRYMNENRDMQREGSSFFL